MTYGVEAVTPVEIGLQSFRVEEYNEVTNHLGLCMEIDITEDRRDIARARMAEHKRASKRYYNTKVRARKFMEGDLVLRKVTPNTRDHDAGVLGPNWEGPYRVIKQIQSATYELEKLD